MSPRHSVRVLVSLLLLTHVFALPGFGGEARIISLVPEITEFLLEMGGGNALVGVSDTCALPGDTALIPRVGSIELNMEKIVALKPTAIFDLNGAHKRYELLFRQLSLTYVNIGIDRLADIPSLRPEDEPFCIDNSLAALAAGWALGVPPKLLAAGIKTFAGEELQAGRKIDRATAPD